MDLTPIYRIEHFLDAIVNNSVNPYSPEYRVEYYLAKIAGENVTIPEPIYRKEFYLAYLCGEEVELPDPIYRIEYYLAFLCGLNVAIPQPIYRVEFWLWDWCGGGGIEKTIIGNPIHITDALAKPAQALSVKLEPIQDLHGYENPWPAGGGKNKWHLYANGYYSSTGTFSPSNSNACSDKIPVTEGEKWTFGAVNRGNVTVTLRGYFFDENDAIVGSQIVGSNSVTTTAPTGAKTVAFWFAATGYSTITQADCDTLGIQAEKGETLTSFAPFSNICPISGHTNADVIVSPTLNPADGTTYPIPLGTTVYGGTLDVTSGVLTVDRALFSKKFSELVDSTGNVPEGYAIKSSGTLSVQGDYSNRTKALCNMASFNDSSNAKNVFRMTSSGNYLYFTLPTDLDSDTVIASCYPLATPITIQLTPTQVELLLGENNIWSDGEMTLTYLADGNASDEEALNILLGGRYVNNHGEDEPTDREALNIILGGNER